MLAKGAVMQGTKVWRRQDLGTNITVASPRHNVRHRYERWSELADDACHNATLEGVACYKGCKGAASYGGLVARAAMEHRWGTGVAMKHHRVVDAGM